MRRSLIALALAGLLAAPAFGQTPYPAGPTNQSSLALIAPTAATSDNSNRIATTAWVNNLVNAGMPLASGKIWIGSPGNIATPQTPSGDLTVSTGGVFTFGTVNANVGSFGSATLCATVTVNAKGLITAASAATCTPAVGSITGLGANIATWLGTPSSANLRSALTDETGTGAAYFQGGDIGTPSAGVATNLTGTAAGLTAGSLLNTIEPQGRLTVTTGTPVLTAATLAQTTVYYTPYIGRLFPIYDGTNWTATAFAEVSQATTDTTKSPAAVTANSNYDVFCWIDSGTNRCTRGPAWSSSTSRGTGAGTTELTRVNGILMNANSITNGPAAQRGTYVGSFRSNGSSQVDWTPGAAASGGTAGNLSIWNQYNRVAFSAQTTDNGTAYTYSSGTIRQARASSGNQISILWGVAEEGMVVQYAMRAQTAAAANAALGVGICALDSTTVYNGAQYVFGNQASAATSTGSTIGAMIAPSLGYHFVAGCENSDNTNNNTFDQGTNNALMVNIRM